MRGLARMELWGEEVTRSLLFLLFLGGGGGKVKGECGGEADTGFFDYNIRKTSEP